MADSFVPIQDAVYFRGSILVLLDNKGIVRVDFDQHIQLFKGNLVPLLVVTPHKIDDQVNSLDLLSRLLEDGLYDSFEIYCLHHSRAVMVLFYKAKFQVVKRSGIDTFGVKILDKVDHLLGILFVAENSLNVTCYIESVSEYYGLTNVSAL